MKPPIVSLAARFPGIAVFLLLPPVLSFPQQLISAKAGLVQFLEGEAYINGSAFRLKDGQYLQLENGQVFRVGKGRAELLLAPDACIRLGGDSLLRIRQNALDDIQLELNQGSALIEISKKLKTEPIRMHISESVVEMKKEGLYRLDTEPRMLRVYGGDARATRGGRKIRVKKGKMVALNDELKPDKFDVDAADALHRWAARRSFGLFAKNLFFTKPVNPRGLAWIRRPEGIYNSHYRVTLPANVDWTRYWLSLWNVLQRQVQERRRRIRSDPGPLPVTPPVFPVPPELQQ